MDFYAEKNVKRRKTKAQKIIAVVALLLSFPLCYVILAYTLAAMKVVGLVLIVAIEGGIYYGLTRMNVEYEFSIVSSSAGSQFDCAKIVNMKKRKELISVDFENVSSIAKFKGMHDNSASCTNKLEIVRSMTCDDIFVMETSDSEGRLAIFFQPDDEMKNFFHMKMPSKYHED